MRVAELPQLDALHVYDKDGNWIVNSRQESPQNLNNALREYFVFHREHTQRGPHIGVPVKSRTNGKLLIPVSRRIDNPDGSFGGVALATMDVEFFGKFYDSLDIGEAGAVALILESGTMMTRRPFSVDSVGRNMRDTGLFRAYTTQGPVGTAEILSAQDGITRLNSFRRLANYPLFAAAALSKDEILAAWWQETLWHTGGVILLTSIVGFVGWRLIRQMELQNKTEAELRRARDALETLNKTLNTLAMEDGLTGLANRRQFDVTLDSEFSRAMRDASTLALILIDVDCFKQYNDIYGHAAGDECLQTIGAHHRKPRGPAPGRSGRALRRGRTGRDPAEDRRGRRRRPRGKDPQRGSRPEDRACRHARGLRDPERWCGRPQPRQDHEPAEGTDPVRRQGALRGQDGGPQPRLHGHASDADMSGARAAAAPHRSDTRKAHKQAR